MTISIGFAFIALLFSTQNILISIYSIVSIGGIVSCVVAVMKFRGWELGITESITVIILIGLSVDYVVHLGTHYVESKH